MYGGSALSCPPEKPLMFPRCSWIKAQLFGMALGLLCGLDSSNDFQSVVLKPPSAAVTASILSRGHFILVLYPLWGFPGGSDGKEPACNAGDPGSIPGLGRSSGEGNGNPLQYSCFVESHGQRSLVGYSSWSHKESDTTEWLTLS